MRRFTEVSAGCGATCGKRLTPSLPQAARSRVICSAFFYALWGRWGGCLIGSAPRLEGPPAMLGLEPADGGLVGGEG
jgi:hypothetical protein